MTLHANVREGADYNAVLLAIRRFLEERFGIGHATVQIEPAGCPDDALHSAPPASRTRAHAC